MSDSPADSVMAAPNPPGHGGVSRAVNEPARAFYSARHEQRAAEHEQRVGDRWTSQCAKADAGAMGVVTRSQPDAASSAPLKPYWRRSPWWWWV